MRPTNDNPIRRARLERGLDQVALVHRIHEQGGKLSLSSLRLAERGVASPKTLQVIAAALSVDAAELGATPPSGAAPTVQP